MAEGVQAIVLCEDLQGWVFVRRMLIALGYDAHRIRVIPFPAGRGAGEQHVRASYPGELNKHRSRAARTKAVLVVHVDAGSLSVAERCANLEEERQAQGVAPRRPEEAVAILVPKTAIETWIHFFLDGPPVDEQTSYPEDNDQADTWPAAKAFARYVRISPPAEAPPSLALGLAEARRIL